MSGYTLNLNEFVATQYQPAHVHNCDNFTYWYWFRYLLKRIISVFKFELPENWAKNYFEYVLFGLGFGAVVKTDKFGVIFQKCGLQGLNVYYQPTNAIISNRFLRGIITPKIGFQTELIRLQPDYSSVCDIVSYYAQKLALAAEAVDMNFINSKLAYVFAASDKTVAESMKKLYDNISAGNPAAFADSKLFDDEGKPRWLPWANDLKANYIAGELTADMRTILNDFDSMVGIPNANTTKRERMLTDEVNANNVETESLSELWLEELNASIAKVNNMFGLEIAVERRFDNNANYRNEDNDSRIV